MSSSAERSAPPCASSRARCISTSTSTRPGVDPVDTSAWIDFFRVAGGLAESVDEALADNEAALCGPVVTELRRGLKSPSERSRILPLLAGCHFVPQPAELWEEAGELGYALARKGVTVKTMDLLIAVHALTYAVPLMTGDSDFKLMQRAGVRLKLVDSGRRR